MTHNPLFCIFNSFQSDLLSINFPCLPIDAFFHRTLDKIMFLFFNKYFFYQLLLLHISFCISCNSLGKEGYKISHYGSATIYNGKSPKGILLRKAALEDSEAQFNLGTMYLTGKGFKQDYSEAAYWLKRSSENGNIKAQYNLACMYIQGWGVTQSYQEAAHWFEKSAEKGDKKSQYNIGVLYLKGVGVKQNFKKGAQYLLKSAKSEYPNAFFVLGSCYFQGIGLNQNFGEASKWFGKSSVSDYQLSQKWLYRASKCLQYDRLRSENDKNHKKSDWVYHKNGSKVELKNDIRFYEKTRVISEKIEWESNSNNLFIKLTHFAEFTRDKRDLLGKEDKYKIDLDESFFPLHAAILLKDIMLVETLIEKGIDLNARTESGIAPIHLAAYYDLAAILEMIINNGGNTGSLLEGKTALDIAIEKNSTEAAKILINRN